MTMASVGSYVGMEAPARRIVTTAQRHHPNDAATTTGPQRWCSHVWKKPQRGEPPRPETQQQREEQQKGRVKRHVRMVVNFGLDRLVGHRHGSTSYEKHTTAPGGGSAL